MTLVLDSKDKDRGIARALLGLVMVAVVPLLVFGGGVAWMIVDQKRAAVAEELKSTARAMRVTVDHDLLSQFAAMEFLASDTSIDARNFMIFHGEALRAIEARHEWRNVVLIDPQSDEIVASALPKSNAPLSAAARAAVDDVVRTGKPMIGGLSAGKIVQQPFVLLLAPVIRGGEVVFVLSVAMDPKPLNDVFAEQHLPPSWTAAVLDGHLTLAGRSRDAERFVGQRATPTLADRIAASDSGMFTALNQEGATVYTVFSRSPATGWTVALGIPAAEVEQPIHRVLMGLAAAAAGLVIPGLILAGTVGRGIIRRRRAYRESRDHYRLLIEGVRDYAIYQVSPEGLVETWNTAAERMKRYKAEDIIGRSISCFYPPEEVAAGLPAQVLAIARRDGRCETEGWRVRSDGSRFWASIVVTALYDHEGNLTGFAKITRDITERRQAEAALKNSEERMRRFFERQLVGMAITSPQKGWLQVNDRLCEMIGYSRDELSRLTWAEITHPDDLPADQAQFELLLAGDIDAYSVEKRFIRKDRSVVHTELSVGCVRHPDGSVDYVLALLADTTATVEASKALAKAKTEAERANLAKSKFLAAVSHDMRQPVQSLVLLLATLEGEVAGQPEAAKTIGMMKSAVSGINGLLSSTLDVSRLDAGVVAPVMEGIDVGAMVARLAGEYALLADGKGLAFRSLRRSLWARSDPALVERILRNLIENALRYTVQGGILVGIRQRGERVRIDVVDTGIGIPADKQSEIFEEFYQVNNPGRDSRQGLGLGLAIVSRLSRLLGAELEVASRLGTGSRFSLLLPGDRDARPAAEGRSAPDFTQSHDRILIVEDDDFLRECLQIMLERWGYQVLAAAQGEQALDIAAREGWRFDAVIADHRLGFGLTGAATAKEIERQAGRPFPVVVLTGDTAMERIAEVHASGYAMLHKPVAPDDLRRTLDALLRVRERSSFP